MKAAKRLPTTNVSHEATRRRRRDRMTDRELAALVARGYRDFMARRMRVSGGWTVPQANDLSP